MSASDILAKAAEIVRREWDSQGGCRSCGWHAALYEYGELESALRLEPCHIALPCLNPDDSLGHRGVRIYWDDTDKQEPSDSASGGPT